MGPYLTDCWYGSNDLTKLEFVQDGGLTSRIKTDLERWNEAPILKKEKKEIIIYHQNTYWMLWDLLDEYEKAMDIRISFFPNRLERRREIERPIVVEGC